MSTRSLPSWRSRSAASHSLGSGHKGNRAPRREHPGSWAGLRARRPFFGKSGVASSWLPWRWWVVSDFPKPPSRALRAPRSVGRDVSPSGPPGVGGLATHPSRGLGLLQLQSPPAESPLRPPTTRPGVPRPPASCPGCHVQLSLPPPLPSARPRGDLMAEEGLALGGLPAASRGQGRAAERAAPAPSPVPPRPGGQAWRPGQSLVDRAEGRAIPPHSAFSGGQRDGWDSAAGRRWGVGRADPACAARGV